MKPDKPQPRAQKIGISATGLELDFIGESLTVRERTEALLATAFSKIDASGGENLTPEMRLTAEILRAVRR